MSPGQQVVESGAAVVLGLFADVQRVTVTFHGASDGGDGGAAVLTIDDGTVTTLRTSGQAVVADARKVAVEALDGDVIVSLRLGVESTASSPSPAPESTSPSSASSATSSSKETAKAHVVAKILTGQTEIPATGGKRIAIKAFASVGPTEFTPGSARLIVNVQDKGGGATNDGGEVSASDIDVDGEILELTTSLVRPHHTLKALLVVRSKSGEAATAEHVIKTVSS